MCRTQILFRVGLVAVRTSTPAMLIRFASLKTAVILLVSIVALFFFPAPRGSFVSTHGPMTMLRWCWESALLWFALALTVGARLASRMVATGVSAGPAHVFADDVQPPGFSILRI
jgi:hypothetical protein